MAGNFKSLKAKNFLPMLGDRQKRFESGKAELIEIEDNGVGMDKETSRRTFDPFFTTKPVGQGTGLGMSIAHKIIKSQYPTRETARVSQKPFQSLPGK